MGLENLSCLGEGQSQVGVSSGKNMSHCDQALVPQVVGGLMFVLLGAESYSLHLIMLHDTMQPILGLRSGKEICFNYLLYSFV